MSKLEEKIGTYLNEIDSNEGQVDRMVDSMERDMKEFFDRLQKMCGDKETKEEIGGYRNEWEGDLSEIQEMIKSSMESSKDTRKRNMRRR